MADTSQQKPRRSKYYQETPRRIVPIVPAIPRKFERSSRPKNGSVTESSPPADDMVKSDKSETLVHPNGSLERLHPAGDRSFDPSEEERSGERKRSVSNCDDQNGNEGIQVETKEDAGIQIFETRDKTQSNVDEAYRAESEVQEKYILNNARNGEGKEKPRDRLSYPETIEEGTHYLATTTETQDSMTQKNGFRLPSPFYPHSSKFFLPSQPQLHIQNLQPHLESRSTDPNLPSSIHPLAEHPSSYIVTPPADDIITQSQTDYRGYGHIPLASSQPEHTPPTDPAPSPKDDSYDKKSSATLNHVQESPQTFNRPPSPCLFYQGYTYVNVNPERLSLSVSPTSHHDVPQGHRSPSHQDEYILFMPSDGRSDGRFSAKPFNNSSKSHKGGAGVSANTFRHPVTKMNNSIGDSRPSWAQRISPTSSLGSSSQSYQPIGAGLYAGESFVAKTESRRSTTLHSLNPQFIEGSANQTPLTAFLLNQFDVDKYADLRLEVIHERDGSVMADFRLHSLIMAQNKIWQDLMNASTSKREGSKLIQLRTNDQFITSQAVEGALRVYYGEPSHVFIGSCLQIDLSKQNADTSLAWMDNALSFAASGHLLGLEEVISRGIHIASSIFCWDNVEKALSFALHGGLDPALDPDHALRVDSLISLAKTSTDSIPSPIRGASGSLRKRVTSGAGSRAPQLNAMRSGPSSLLPHCLNFIASEFPISWNLEPSACALAEIDRLPLTVKDYSLSNKSRLVSIRFGDCPPEILSIARHRDSVLSSILLSLPFVPLKYILDQLPNSTRSKIIGPIVDERERRRKHALEEGKVDWSRRIVDADHLAYLGWKEYVVSKQDSVLALERRWTNFDESHSE